jgi:Sulfite exporter TauE/SafE
VSRIAVLSALPCRIFEPSTLESTQQSQELGGGRDDDVRGIHELRRRLVGRDGDSHSDLETVQSPERVHVRPVVARVERAAEARLGQELRHRGAFVGAHRRADLEHLSAEARNETRRPCSVGHRLEVLERSRLVFGLAVVERDRQSLVLDGPVDPVGERAELVSPAAGLRRELQSVRADVADAFDTDHPPRVVARPAADRRDERIPAREPPNLGASRIRHACILRSSHDRSERPVHVQQDRRASRLLGKAVEVGHGSYDTAVRFVLIGLLAGFFSALLGVGGGIIVVPLLILAGGFPERSAMATSLASIGLIAAVGSLSYGVRGDVDIPYALLLGLPAALGAVAGASLQQRLATRFLSLSFAVLLAALGVWLLI